MAPSILFIFQVLFPLQAMHRLQVKRWGLNFNSLLHSFTVSFFHALLRLRLFLVYKISIILSVAATLYQLYHFLVNGDQYMSCRSRQIIKDTKFTMQQGLSVAGNNQVVFAVKSGVMKQCCCYECCYEWFCMHHLSGKPLPHWDTIKSHFTLSASVEGLSTAGTRANPPHRCSTTSKAAEAAEPVTALAARLPLLSCSIES